MVSCSFCRKDSAHVTKMVAGPRRWLVGPRVYICDACVAVSARLMGPDAAATPPVEAPRASWRTFVDRVARYLPGQRAQQVSA